LLIGWVKTTTVFGGEDVRAGTLFLKVGGQKRKEDHLNTGGGMAVVSGKMTSRSGGQAGDKLDLGTGAPA